MGAGASAASLPIAERRQMYEVLKEKYTRSDIDTLAEEEKQAWLEVLEEQSKPAATSGLSGTSPSAVHDHSIGNDTGSAAENDVVVAAATTATRTAARTAAADNGNSCGEGGVRAQRRKTRMSYNLLPEEVATAGKLSNDEGGKQPTPEQDACGLETEGRSPPCTELPAWRRTAELVENASELCIGDVVRARDVECNGMWFEGVLTAIHDESSFSVEMTGGAAGETADSITVGMNDIVRVMPWFCIEVGDPVECQPEGTMWWVRGTVVNIVLSEGLYDVVLESGALAESDQAMEGLSGGGEKEPGLQQEEGKEKEKEKENTAVAYRITERRIRKIGSGRQATARGGRESNSGDSFMTRGEYVMSLLAKWDARERPPHAGD